MAIQLEIKIKGYGTKEEILAALKVVIKSIDSETPEKLATGKEFEDKVLMTEISEDENPKR